MSFSFLLQRQGIISRIVPARVLCRTCLLSRPPSSSSSSSSPSSPIFCHNTRSILFARLPPLSLQQHQKRYVHISLQKDPQVEKLVKLLSRPPPPYNRADPVKTAKYPSRRRKYRMQLSTLYQSIRQNIDQWRQLNMQQLMALFMTLKPSIAEPSTALLTVNAQHILLDIQQHTPQEFTMAHVELLLSTYKDIDNLDRALALMEWLKHANRRPSAKVYEWMILILTTSRSRSCDSSNRMALALEYWGTLSKMDIDDSTRSQLIGYMTQGYLVEGDVMKAAKWVSVNRHTQQAGNDAAWAVSVVGDELDRLMEQAACVGRYEDAQQFYRQFCSLLQLTEDYQDKKVGTKGLSELISSCRAANKVSMIQQLLDDAVEFKHNQGVEMISEVLVHSHASADNLRGAVDIYFQYPEYQSMSQTRNLLIKAAKAKYHTDMYRLYQHFANRFPSHMTLRLYTRVLQTLVQTREYDLARQVYQDVIHDNRHQFTAHHTPRFFHVAYSLCAQLGDIELFQSIVALQRQAGLPLLAHQSYSSLMATYIKAGEVGLAKVVFDHMAQYLDQQQQQQQYDDLFGKSDSNLLNSQQHQEPNVDVVDFNLLIRTIGEEHQQLLKRQEKGQQDETDEPLEPLANRILKVLRYMAMVGISPNATTLRTLADLYPEGGALEDEIFTKLLTDPDCKRHDHIWLNNMKLTRKLHKYEKQTVDEKERIQLNAKAAFEASTAFLSNRRRNLFPKAMPNEKILADGMTYKILLDSLTRHPKHAALAQRVYDHMRARGWRPSAIVYREMMEVWARKERLNKAAAVIDQARRELGWSKEPVAWYTLVLDRLILQKNQHLAEMWIKQMKKKEIIPDTVLKQRLLHYGLDHHFSSSSQSQQDSSLTTDDQTGKHQPQRQEQNHLHVFTS